MKIFTLQAALWVPRPIPEVFEFFADARNLEQITPSWLNFRILAPASIEIRAGSRIAYQLRIRGVPIRWESEITAWEPPHRFVDEQRRGPYRQWIHEHLFVSENDGTTIVDNVRYSVLGGALVNHLVVAPDVRKIFEYRKRVLLERFG
jgi:ligand-binding SRPBCC domain-containing protein